ncbi:hypothetical protein IL306_010669, partial [Fusarium sp. DS 682]
DLQDQQSSALSRIDTLSKRNLGSRTPDLTPPAPSPASATFGDRFITRSVLAKASAPNLRSFSPPSSSQMSPVDSVNKFPSMDQKAFGATPPLSPPISETGEAQPFDRSRIISRTNTNSQYDESRFAQRQMQMQQGRETPTNRFRTDSNSSLPGPRSRSSSAHRPQLEKNESGSFQTEPTVQEESHPSTFFDDDDDQPIDQSHIRPIAPLQVSVQKPADDEHPALRRPTMPTPLSITEEIAIATASSADKLPKDSPTLGPTSGGLSGLVRQHLRQDSGASSIYGSLPNDVELSSRFPPERPGAHTYEPKAMDSNAWESIERDLAMSIDGSVTSPTESSGLMEAQISSAQNSKQQVDPQPEEETDDFARHLADGARRVRERLTSFVEADSSISSPEHPPLSELPPLPRPNALGILKSKSSRGSLVDRGRGDRDNAGQSKAKKLLGLRGSSPARPATSSRRGSFEGNERLAQSPEPRDENLPRDGEEKEGVHAGLKAFRQARRELQRMKELEVQQRYQGPQMPPSTGRERSQTTTTSRPPSQEPRAPPPVSYNRVPSEEARANAGSRAGSRSGSRAPSERDRSGSEASSGGRSGSRPPRLRNGSVPRDDYQGPMGSPVGNNGKPRQGPMMRAPMMPGQDMRRSPRMPPQHYAGNASRPDNSLHIHPVYGHDSGHPSPISPLNGAPSPHGGPSPHGFPGPQRPYGSPYPGGMMRNRDMPEPSINQPMSPMGHRDGLGPGPGPGLNGGAVSTPNLHSNSTAPPLPPINPRRKNTGATLAEGTMSANRRPMSPSMANDQRVGFPSDDEDGPGMNRQRLRKATSEANGMNARARSMHQAPPPPMAAPPLPPSMSSNAVPGGYI